MKPLYLVARNGHLLGIYLDKILARVKKEEFEEDGSFEKASNNVYIYSGNFKEVE